MYNASNVLISYPGVGNVEAEMPDDFQISVESQYETPFQIDLSASTRGIIGKFSDVTGVDISGTSSWDVMQVWMGTSPLSMSFDLEIFADGGNLKRDVLSLLQMAAPVKAGKFTLRAPNANEDAGSISFGNFMILTSVLFTSVSSNFSKPIMVDGQMSKAVVSLSLITSKILTRGTISGMFK